LCDYIDIMFHYCLSPYKNALSGTYYSWELDFYGFVKT
jgi:hypothetical protein